MPRKRREKVLLRSASYEPRKNKWEVPLSTDDLPDAKTQREIIESLQPDEDDHEAFYYEYAVCKHWYKTWRKYLGYEDGKHPGQTIPPGPVQMNQDRNNNDFIKGHIWKQLLEWYDLDDQHELDRRYVGDEEETIGPEKLFEINVFRPISTNFQNYTKVICTREYIGYIESQIRRIVKVPDYRQSRLWICEKQKESQFVMLKDRTEELWFAHGLDDDKTYVLAIEIRGDDGIWPSGHPDAPDDDLNIFTEVTQGHKWTNKWKNEIRTEMTNFMDGCLTQMKGYMERYLHGMYEREDKRVNELRVLKARIRKEKNVNNQWTEILEERSKEIDEITKSLKKDRFQLQDEKIKFQVLKEKFYEELEHVNELNKVTDKLINLNIGGHMFVTSTVTLTRDPDSMLGAMFSGRHQLQRTADNTVFIDRDGTHFRYILNYLRDGSLRPSTLPTDSNILQELIVEADFYQLQGLLQFLYAHTGERDSDHFQDDASLKSEFKSLAGMFELYNLEE